MYALMLMTGDATGRPGWCQSQGGLKMPGMSSYETLLYTVDGAIATITFTRPERLNTIVPPMPEELEDAVWTASRDEAVKVIVLRGAGRGFCAGFDFSDGLSHWNDALNTDGQWDPGKDFAMVLDPSRGPVPKFMSLWRTP